jgi:hypothetical protein
MEMSDVGGRIPAPALDRALVNSGRATRVASGPLGGRTDGFGTAARKSGLGGSNRLSLAGGGPVGGSGMVLGNSSGGFRGISLGAGGGPGSGSTGGGN